MAVVRSAVAATAEAVLVLLVLPLAFSSWRVSTLMCWSMQSLVESVVIFAIFTIHVQLVDCYQQSHECLKD